MSSVFLVLHIDKKGNVVKSNVMRYGKRRVKNHPKFALIG
jgi:hypothetical protein